jgi:hypothetical protein
MVIKLFTTAGHTQLPGRGVANVGSFGYLSGNPTRKCPEAATAHTGGRQPVQKLLKLLITRIAINW